MGNLRRTSLRTATTDEIGNLASFLNGNYKAGTNLFINPEAGTFTYGASLERMKTGDIFVGNVSQFSGQLTAFEFGRQQLMDSPEGAAALVQINSWLATVQPGRPIREATFTPALGKKTFAGTAVISGSKIVRAQFVSYGGKYASRIRLHETPKGVIAGIALGAKYYGQPVTSNLNALVESNWRQMYATPTGRNIAGVSQSGKNVMAFSFGGAYQFADLNDIVTGATTAQARALTPVMKSSIGVITAQTKGNEAYLLCAKYGSGATSVLRVNSHRVPESVRAAVRIEKQRGGLVPFSLS